MHAMAKGQMEQELPTHCSFELSPMKSHHATRKSSDRFLRCDLLLDHLSQADRRDGSDLHGRKVARCHCLVACCAGECDSSRRWRHADDQSAGAENGRDNHFPADPRHPLSRAALAAASLAMESIPGQPVPAGPGKSDGRGLTWRGFCLRLTLLCHFTIQDWGFIHAFLLPCHRSACP